MRFSVRHLILLDVAFRQENIKCTNDVTSYLSLSLSFGIYISHHHHQGCSAYYNIGTINVMNGTHNDDMIKKKGVLFFPGKRFPRTHIYDKIICTYKKVYAPFGLLIHLFF